MKYGQYGCDKVLREAKDICACNSIDAKFNDQKRTAIKSNVANDEEFRLKVFLPIIESARHSISERFQALHKHNELFSFLYDFDSYEVNSKNGSLLKSCKNLEIALSHNGKSDIDGEDLFAELQVVFTLTKNEKTNHVIEILNTIQKQNMENIVPNAIIAFRIMLTIPVSVASGERSFSKLKLIKNYLRNSMGQERLSELAIISIENNIASSINYDDIIDDFATAKARKKDF